MTTKKQRAAIHFCESWLGVSFRGNQFDFNEVSKYLSEHLNNAKRLYIEAKCDYEAYIWEKL